MTDYWHKTRKCKNCGKEFRCYRNSRAESCSAACRKAWSRRKDQIKRSGNNIMTELLHLRNLMQRYPDLQPQTLEQLRFLQTEVRFLLLLGKDAEEQDRFQMVNDIAARRDRP